MRLTLVDPKQEMCAAWERAFHVPPSTASSGKSAPSGLPGTVRVVNAGFEALLPELEASGETWALVTAGNSFGLMDGGVDLAVARAFPEVEARVQRTIREDWYGELNVGDAFAEVISVNEEDRLHRGLLVYAPTMRVPMDIRGTDNVYMAMWAALGVVGHDGGYWGTKHLIVPGLGTGAGMMALDDAARQMALAWRNFNNPPERMDWAEANRRHHQIVRNICCGWDGR